MKGFSSLDPHDRKMIISAMDSEINRANAYQQKCNERKMVSGVSKVILANIRSIQDAMFADKPTEGVILSILCMSPLKDCSDEFANRLWALIGK